MKNNKWLVHNGKQQQNCWYSKTNISRRVWHGNMKNLLKKASSWGFSFIFIKWTLYRSNFSLHCQCLFKHTAHKNKGNDNQRNNYFMFNQSLPNSISRNMWRRVRRKWMLTTPEISGVYIPFSSSSSSDDVKHTSPGWKDNIWQLFSHKITILFNNNNLYGNTCNQQLVIQLSFVAGSR